MNAKKSFLYVANIQPGKALCLIYTEMLTSLLYHLYWVVSTKHTNSDYFTHITYLQISTTLLTQGSIQYYKSVEELSSAAIMIVF